MRGTAWLLPIVVLAATACSSTDDSPPIDASTTSQAGSGGRGGTSSGGGGSGGAGGGGLSAGVTNGWYTRHGRLVWGYAQHNGWWRAGQRANITRNAPGEVGPNRTEDLDLLTDNMLQHAYPGFEHNFGLWYDRRRDAHDTACRTDDGVVSPFLEQPWARSSSGTACDGLADYDLTRYNDWYFERLTQFADLSAQKGTVFFHNFYMQHALLETNAHYVDFPWRPDNCVQDTGMPAATPAANAFYDISHTGRRDLHRAYIRKCLDELRDYPDVVHLASEEYTGPLAFMEFWIDTVLEWQQDSGRTVHIGLGATKDVLDAVLADPIRGAEIDTIDLRYFWYEPDGTLHAPQGGQQIAGRYSSGSDVAATTPEQLYRQIVEYRQSFPDKAIIHTVVASRQQSWALLMAGGSMLVRRMEYVGGADPPAYEAPEASAILQPTYDFLSQQLADSLLDARPADLVLETPERNWCLAADDQTYLTYLLEGGSFQLDLSGASGTFTASWFDPRSGDLSDANGGSVTAGDTVSFTAPDQRDWALWLRRP